MPPALITAGLQNGGMESPWHDRKPNAKFPACAQVARKLLAEVYGCKPGDQIPAEAELMARAEQVAAWGQDWPPDPEEAAKARTALSMVREIGGL
jgi:endonuclease YncB( thermonuclease family)